MRTIREQKNRIVNHTFGLIPNWFSVVFSAYKVHLVPLISMDLSSGFIP